ncbi:MAG TPA: FHA domain-containing protein [Fimbriimonas sp.]|nr:FHA domain-containing protein [Fimbriimonas sp.]
MVATMSVNITATGLSGMLTGKKFALGAEPVTIGRNPDCTIPLSDDSGVSRSHAQLFVQADQAFIADLGSSNGTLVNGERLTSPRQLQDQDVVTVGASTLRINVSQLQLPKQMTSHGQSVCILCGGSQVMSLQSITAARVSSTVGTTVSVGGAHVLGGGPNLVGGSVGTSRSVTKTDLAKMLAFPYPVPKTETFTDSGTHIGAAIWILSSIALAVPLTPMGLWWVAVIAGLILGATVSVMLRGQNRAKYADAELLHHRKQTEERREYDARRVIYDRTLYCPQCHSIFDPMTGRSAKPDSLPSIM